MEPTFIPTWAIVAITFVGAVMCAIQGFTLWQISDMKSDIKVLKDAKEGRPCQVHLMRLETLEKNEVEIFRRLNDIEKHS